MSECKHPNVSSEQRNSACGCWICPDCDYRNFCMPVYKDQYNNPKSSTGKRDAIAKIKKITEGCGIDRDKYPEEMRGQLAKRLWHSGKFSYGMEYGYILCLVEIFGITVKDLENE